ncbi:hypothetical protein KI387_029920, partial [Taxus chinensis]
VHRVTQPISVSMRPFGIERYMDFPDNGLLDIAPIKNKPTWVNNRTGSASVSKRLDRLLLHNHLMMDMDHIRNWIAGTQCSYHFPIVLDIEDDGVKQGAPFKFNPAWILDQDFNNLVKENWRPFDPSTSNYVCQQFHDSLRNLKQLASKWASSKYKKCSQLLKQTEGKLTALISAQEGCLFSEEVLYEIKELETHKNKLLLEEEMEWRMKSHTT